MKLCNHLKYFRLQKGLTQEALASAVGVTRQTVIAIEREKFVPSARLALELAAVLGAPFNDIFWLETDQGEKP